MNPKGAIAYIESYCNETIIAFLDCDNSDAEQICQKAAKELRRLANAFDRLAKAEKPFTSDSQQRAMTELIEGE